MSDVFFGATPFHLLGACAPASGISQAIPKPNISTSITPSTISTQTSEPPPNGDWVISVPSIMENKTATLNGYLLVKPGGSLALRNSKLMINCTRDGADGISVEPGSSIFIDHTTIASTSQYRFSFVVKGDSFKMQDSSLRGCGWGRPYLHMTQRKRSLLENRKGRFN